MVVSLLGLVDWEPQILRVREAIQKVRQDLAFMAVGEAGKHVAQSRLRDLMERR